MSGREAGALVFRKSCIFEGLMSRDSGCLLDEQFSAEVLDNISSRLRNESIDQYFERTISDPLARCWKGSSDPFDSAIITVTAQVNNLLTFQRQKIDVATKSLDIDLSPCNGMLEEAGRHPLREITFISPVALLATLGRIAAIISHYLGDSPEYLSLAVLYKAQSVARFRRELSKQGGPVDFINVGGPALSLALSELAMRKFDTATIHLKAVEALLRENTTGWYGSPHTLFIATYLDTERAIVGMLPPVFDYAPNSWIHERFAEMWSQAQLLLPPRIFHTESSLDPSIDQPECRRFFQDAREIFQVLELALEEAKSEGIRLWNQPAQATVWLYLATRMSILMGSMHAAVTGAFSAAKICDLGAGSLFNKTGMFVQRGAVIAAGHYSRRIAHLDASPAILGGPLGDVCYGHVPLQRLRRAIKAADQLVGFSSESSYAHLRLWTLYVGAQHAQDPNARDGRPTAADMEDRRWFVLEFGRQAHRLNLSSWQECEKILQGFLYSRWAKPHLRDWYGRVLEQSQPPSRHAHGIRVRKWICETGQRRR